MYEDFFDTIYFKMRDVKEIPIFTSPAHGNLNILECSRHILNFSDNYCDSCNQLLSIVKTCVINQCFHMTPEIKIKTG